MEEVTGRDPGNGRFTVGNPGGPGRKKRETEQAILQAITDALSPAQITEAIQTALDIAIEQRSARGIIAVLELGASYAVGKPVQRIEKTEGDPITEALERLNQMYIDRQQAGQAAQG